MPKNIYERGGILWARFKVNGVEYRVRREDILGDIAKRVIKGERVPKAGAAPESEAA